MKRIFRVMPTVITLAAAPFAVGTLLFGQAVPTFVGVRTFMGAPYVPKLDALEADFAVLGVPFDEGTWGQPGARYGPRDLRENSQEYHHDLTEGFYYIDGDRTVLKGKRWVDVSDIDPALPLQNRSVAVNVIEAFREVVMVFLRVLAQIARPVPRAGLPPGPLVERHPQHGEVGLERVELRHIRRAHERPHADERGHRLPEQKRPDRERSGRERDDCRHDAEDSLHRRGLRLTTDHASYPDPGH